MASFLQELPLIFIQRPSVPLLSDVPRHRVISACPLWPGGTAGICSLQCDAHASVGMSHAVSSALSYPAFGKALRAQKGWQNDREASEAREWRLHSQMPIISTDRRIIWVMPEFPARVWIKGTQVCRDVVDGNCKLPTVSNTWTGLSPCGAGGHGLVSERREPREMGRGLQGSPGVGVVPVALCDWRRGGVVLFGTAQWPCCHAPALWVVDRVLLCRSLRMLRCCW